MNIPRLYFIRHGETDWNAAGRLQGQRDIPLNETGRRQAAAVAAVLKRLSAGGGDLPWWSSPLGRARETAELARAGLGLNAPDYRMDDRLKELAFGEWEGLTWPEVERHSPALAARRLADKWNTLPPGGENYEVLAERIGSFLGQLGGDSVIVSHGGVGRALMALSGALGRREAAETFVRQGVVYLFEPGRFAVEGP
ncbi:histidine phosphatase family protein [Phreatobacter sp.]|uniref:histidine phosphatase family protein n=1 Tax=Phreatobacter sp. TaxID=1966341 RepID=UPI003F709B5A